MIDDSCSPGEGYIVTVYSKNNKGRSEPMTLHAFTLRDEPRHIGKYLCNNLPNTYDFQFLP